MERAAELLRTGRYNVTEAATEVGYSSLSHFSKGILRNDRLLPRALSRGEKRHSRPLSDRVKGGYKSHIGTILLLRNACNRG